jgi:CheY-like chemotaxis protein
MNVARVIVVDDNHFWLEALSEYLQRNGFSVVAVSHPAEALALLRKNNVAGIICDYDMPEMNGLELVRLVCRQSTVPILVVSNEEEPSLASRALAEGARGFLAKTASPTQLLRKLRQILAATDAAAEQPSPLHLWQRLLPSPHRVRHRNQKRPAARSGTGISGRSPREALSDKSLARSDRMQ